MADLMHDLNELPALDEKMNEPSDANLSRLQMYALSDDSDSDSSEDAEDEIDDATKQEWDADGFPVLRKPSPYRGEHSRVSPPKVFPTTDVNMLNLGAMPMAVQAVLSKYPLSKVNISGTEEGMMICGNPACSTLQGLDSVSQELEQQLAAANLKLCSACKAVRYCSRECQLADRKAHKGFCKQLALEAAVNAIEERERAAEIAARPVVGNDDGVSLSDLMQLSSLRSDETTATEQAVREKPTVEDDEDESAAVFAQLQTILQDKQREDDEKSSKNPPAEAEEPDMPADREVIDLEPLRGPAPQLQVNDPFFNLPADLKQRLQQSLESEHLDPVMNPLSGMDWSLPPEGDLMTPDQFAACEVVIDAEEAKHAEANTVEGEVGADGFITIQL